MAEDKKRDMFDMAGLMESAFMMGIGALEVTKEKTGEIANDLVERGKMSKSDAKEVAERLSDMAEKQQEAVKEVVARETDKAVKNSGMASKEDVDDLRAQMAEIKAMLIAQSGGAAPAAPSDE